MQISPINSCNFNGRIKPSPILEEIKSHANKESLARFESMTKKIANIDDGLVFDFAKSKNYKMVTNEVATIHDYNIYKTNENNTNRDLIYSIEENINTYSTPETTKKRKAMILDVVTNFFENNFYARKESSNNAKIREELNVNK